MTDKTVDDYLGRDPEERPDDTVVFLPGSNPSECVVAALQELQTEEASSEVIVATLQSFAAPRGRLERHGLREQIVPELKRLGIAAPGGMADAWLHTKEKKPEPALI